MRSKNPFFTTFLLSSALLTSAAQAGVTVTDCVIREPATCASATALYMNVNYVVDEEVKSLRLPGPEAVVGARAPEITKNIELHNVSMQDGVMKMHQIPRLRLEEGTTALKPGSYHFMLKDLKIKPVAGQTYPIEVLLTYQQDPTCTAIVKTSKEISK